MRWAPFSGSYRINDPPPEVIFERRRARRRARLIETSTGHLCCERSAGERVWKEGSSLSCSTCEQVFAGLGPGQE